MQSSKPDPMVLRPASLVHRGILGYLLAHGHLPSFGLQLLFFFFEGGFEVEDVLYPSGHVHIKRKVESP